jgi:oligoendopeptidase F
MSWMIVGRMITNPFRSIVYVVSIILSLSFYKKYQVNNELKETLLNLMKKGGESSIEGFLDIITNDTENDLFQNSSLFLQRMVKSLNNE